MRIPHNERVELISRLKYSLKDFYVYYNNDNKRIFLTHAGFTPILDEDPDDIIWNRNHIKDKWNLENDFQDIIIAHGHTIVWTLNSYDGALNPEKVDEMITYCSGHKIDIDMGSAFTGKACLLDLDTLKPIYFTIDNFDKKEYNNYIK